MRPRFRLAVATPTSDTAPGSTGTAFDSAHGDHSHQQSSIYADGNHKDEHKAGGLDPFLSTDIIEALVKRLRESGGQNLDLGAVVAGDFLRRVGTNVVGAFLNDIKWFEIDGIGASFATGALGFTPTHAFVIYHLAGTSDLGGFGLATGTSSNAQKAVRVVSGGSTVSSNRIIQSPNEWNVTAFSSAGVTLTRQTGAGSLDVGILAVLSAT